MSEINGSSGKSDIAEEPTKPLMAWLGFGICVQCFAFSILMVALLLSVLFTLLHVPSGIETLSLRDTLSFSYRVAIAPLLTFFAEILKSFSPWGIITIGVLWIILRGPSWIRESFSTGQWEIAGFKYDGREVVSAFKKELGDAARIVVRANKEIREAYSTAESYASQLRDRFQIGVLASKLAVDVANILGPDCPDDYQFTLYVTDFVFGDRLYQFTEYYDKKGDQVSTGKAGRTYSIRYGIIGRVWRSGVPEIEGELISAEEKAGANLNPLQIERFIARRWGLTLEEAVRIREYHSYGAIRLNMADKPVGLIFFYSKEVNAFGDNDELKVKHERIEAILDGSRLTKQLLEISNEVASWSGRIQVFKNS
jgi:hypothetical protein